MFVLKLFDIGIQNLLRNRYYYLFINILQNNY